MTDEGLIDIPAAAGSLGVTPRFVRRLIAERRVPYYKVGHYVRFSPIELNEWIREQRMAPVTELTAV